MTDQKESNTSAPMVTLKGYEVNPRKRLHAFDSGASLAYEARDVQGNLFVALVADPKMIPRLGNIMAYDLLADTSLMRLMAHGVCDWRLDNAQRYIFVYRSSADTTLIDGNGFLKAKWRQPEILQCFIRPMAKILQEMKDRNFFHGAIRPDNIYFSPARSSEAIILGDCLSSQPSALQPVLYESLERAMADPMGRGMGASVDDVYAFGVTLAMMLRTQDALSGLSDEDIMKRKMELGSYVTIIGRERFSASILTLLRGVLHDEPEKRWGVEEINSWLDGGKSNPPQAGTRKKASRPMIFMGEKYFFANSLAMDIHKSPKELSEIVDNESLGQWLDKALSDKDTLDRYNEALERVAKNGRGNADYLVSCVRMALAPSFPIHYKGINFTYEGIGGLLASAMYQKKDLRAFYDILALNLAVSNLLLKGLPQNIVVMIMKRFETCRNSIKQDKMGFGVEYCVYQLCDDAFCMSPKLEKFLVRGRKEMLLAFEALSEAGGETGLFLDRHSVAMISVSDSNAVEAALFDLNAVDRDRKILGNLKAFASLQKRLGAGGMPATANVFLSNLSGVYKKFHNKALRKKIEEMVGMAAKIGDLAGMEAAIENMRVVQKDQIEFRRARQEYINLTNEYINLIQRMQNKAGFGVSKGRDVAAIISWMIATLMTIMVVLAFLSGNHIF